MNKTLRNTVDQFVTDTLPAIEAAQSNYKTTDRTDTRFSTGRFFDGEKTHDEAPVDGNQKAVEKAWPEDCLPASMPCSMQMFSLEVRGVLGWMTLVEYQDEGVRYVRTLASISEKSAGWDSVREPPKEVSPR